MLMKSFLRRIYYRLFYRDLPSYRWKLKEKASASRGIRKRLYVHRWNMFQKKCGAGISVTAEFAGPPTFPHGFCGVFVSAGAKVGKGCVIFHQVTIGSNTLPDSKHPGAPTIGDNVYIGVGAKIIGGIHIGNNVRIGANCVVTRDVPDNTTVVLPSVRLITRENSPDNTFLPWSDFEGTS